MDIREKTKSRAGWFNLKTKNEMPSVGKGPKFSYPWLSINLKDAPIEDGDVGKTLSAEVKLKVTAIDRHLKEGGGGEDRATFDVVEIKFV